MGDDGFQQFGRRVRALRGAMPLRELARAVYTNKSTLSRVERGQQLPDPLLTERLDGYLGCEGTLLAQRSQLAGPRRQPAAPTWRRRWLHNYPAAYSGEIYMHLLVPAEQRPLEVDLTVDWGPWRLERGVLVVDEAGVLLAHSKGDDGLSIPVVVQTVPASIITFHTGSPPGPAVDINPGWRWTGR